MNLDFIAEMAWKSAAIAGAALIVLALLRSRSAIDRAAVLQLAVVLLLLLPLLSATLPALQLEEPTPAPVAMPLPSIEMAEANDAVGELAVGALATADMAAAELQIAASAPTAPSLFMHLSVDALLKLLYATGLLLIVARLLAGLRTLQRWTDGAEEVAAPLWTGAFRRARAVAGATPRLRLLVSDKVPSPMSWGLRDPVILLDRATLNRPEDAEAILAHEIAHVVRRDWPMLMASRTAAALFWFNPLVWLLERALVQQAEEAADLHAVDRIEPTTYAQTLVTCFRHTTGAALPANSIAARHGLARRVSAILDTHRRGTPSGSAWTTTAMVACVAIAAPVAALELVPPTPPVPPAAPAAPSAPHAPAAPRPPTAPSAPAAPAVPQPLAAPAAEPNVASTKLPQLAHLDETIAAAATSAVASAEVAAASAADSAEAAVDAQASADVIAPEMLVQMKIHGVNADYLEAISAISPRFARLDPKELIAFRIHGLSPARLRQFAELGYGNADQEDLVAMAVHGVSPAFIRDMAGAGYRGLSPEKLVAMRIHGVSPERVRRANAAERGLTPDHLVEMSINGRL